MIDYLREVLYPLGFLSTLAFGSRMLLQWIKSEAAGKSVVMPMFWKLSLCGNLLLLTHSFIQMQFHVCVIQACNAVISWRNLNLMLSDQRQVTTTRTIQILLAAIAAVFFMFLLQGYYLHEGIIDWFRIPTTPWQIHANKQISLSWHFIGFTGLILFSSRFWLQWWCIEKYKISYLGSSFWWCSLIGEGLCLIYFLRIEDPVNFIGPAFGLIPYLRNLVLIYRNKKQPSKGLG